MTLVNHALIAVAQEVAELLKQAYPVQADSSDRTGTSAVRTIEPLTKRESEVLQLIANGYSNAAIARKLHITVGTVKTYVRNILSKVYNY